MIEVENIEDHEEILAFLTRKFKVAGENGILNIPFAKLHQERYLKRYYRDKPGSLTIKIQRTNSDKTKLFFSQPQGSEKINVQEVAKRIVSHLEAEKENPSLQEQA